MGCFNVACSVSSISINDGTPVAFIPLHPDFGYQEKVHRIEPTSTILHPNEYFNPLTLPIFGRYDDYGSIDSIQRDDNVKAIEATFGMPIEQFIEIATCNRRDINDTNSALFKAYAVHQDILRYGVEVLTPHFFKCLGFDTTSTTSSESVYSYPDIPYKVIVSNDGDNIKYSIADEQGTVLRKNFGPYSNKTFLEDFYALSGYHMNVAADRQRYVDLFQQISGMFVHGEIYDMMANDRESVVKNQSLYDHLQTKIYAYEEEKAKLDTTDPDYPTELFRLRMFHDPFQQRIDDYKSILYQFREWPHFKKIYQQPILENKLRDELSTYLSFYHNLFSMNRMLFPAMNGEQHGNVYASQKLYEKSLEITNRQVAEIEE